MRTALINIPFMDQFPVFDIDGYSKKSGIIDFFISLWLDGVPSSLPVDISEIGISGEYKILFTPNAIGFWKLEIEIPFNKQIWKAEIECDYPAGSITAVHRVFQYTAADNGMTARFGIWVEEAGSPRLDIDSIAATIYDNQGNEIVDLGIQTAHTDEGVFEFSTLSSYLANSTPYYIAITVTRGVNIWKANLGVTTA